METSEVNKKKLEELLSDIPDYLKTDEEEIETSLIVSLRQAFTELERDTNRREKVTQRNYRVWQCPTCDTMHTEEAIHQIGENCARCGPAKMEPEGWRWKWRTSDPLRKVLCPFCGAKHLNLFKKPQEFIFWCIRCQTGGYVYRGLIRSRIPVEELFKLENYSRIEPKSDNEPIRHTPSPEP